jgi:uncharacterized membrane protein
MELHERIGGAIFGFVIGAFIELIVLIVSAMVMKQLSVPVMITIPSVPLICTLAGIFAEELKPIAEAMSRIK